MATTNPIENPQADDIVEVGGLDSPGLCKLSGWKRSTEWDIKKGKGTKGGTATLTQLPPAEGSITFYLWTSAHFDEWVAFRKKFIYDPTKKAVQAVDIFHTSLAEIGVTSVVCKSIGARVHEGQGLYSIEVELLEYLPPAKKPATGTPTGSGADKANAGSGKSDDPIADAQQKEIAKLLAEAQKP